MSQSVFISYARKTSWEEAHALHSMLGTTIAYLDDADIDGGESIPKGLTDALLASRVVVVFVDARYFTRWYCIREWLLTRAAFDEATFTQGLSSDASAALSHIVIALSPDAGDELLARLPPTLRHRSWPLKADVAALHALVTKHLAMNPPTLRDRLRAANVSDARITSLVAKAAVPQPLNLAQCRVVPNVLPASLGDGLAGRANELWALHAALLDLRSDSTTSSGAACALHGLGGIGKSRLALEYVHRYAPAHFSGGIFWLDASAAAPIDPQHHEMLRALRGATPSLEAMREAGQVVRTELEAALRQEAARAPVLVVVDNVADPGQGEQPRAVSDLCPGFGVVSCIATSRKRLDSDSSIRGLEIDVLDEDAALEVLMRDVATHAVLERGQWLEVARWVGCLPLALVVLNASFRFSAVSPEEAFVASQARSGTTRWLDQQMAVLRDSIPAGALRGVTEAFSLSYDRLDADCKRLARGISHLADAPIPTSVIVSHPDMVDWRRARGVLVDRSILSACARQTAQALEAVSMHPVMRDFLRAVPEANVRELFAAGFALSLALRKCDLESSGGRSQANALLPHLVHSCRVLHLNLPDDSEVMEFRSNDMWDCANLLTQLGSVTGTDAPLMAAGDILAVRLACHGRHREPVEWATTQWGLGKVFQAIGLHRQEPAWLQSSETRLRAAMEVFDEATTPHEWQLVRTMLGRVLLDLGKRLGNCENLREARDIMRLLVRSPPAVGGEDDHAERLVIMGNACIELGIRTSDTAMLAEGEKSFVDALGCEGITVGSETWARIHMDLGNAISQAAALSRPVGGPVAALTSLDNALTVMTRERFPVEWGRCHHNRGRVLLALGRRRQSLGDLNAAEESCRHALSVRRVQDAPLLWARTRMSLAEILTAKASMEDDSATRLWEAKHCAEEVLTVLDRRFAPVEWGEAISMKGRILSQLGAKLRHRVLLEEAVAAHEAGIRASVDPADGIQLVSKRVELARAEAQLGLMKGDAEMLARALENFRATIEQRGRLGILDEASSRDEICDRLALHIMLLPTRQS